MNSVLAEILDSRRVQRPDGGYVELESNISAEDGAYLQEIIAELRPLRTIEIGMAYGISTMFICEALAAVNGAKHIVIDPYQRSVPDTLVGSDLQPADPGWESLGLYNVERAGYSKLIEFHEEPSYLALPRLVAEGAKVDFAFVDGMHTFDYVLVDFFYLDLMFNVGGMIVFDDMTYPSIRKACRYIVRNRAYEPVQTAQPTHSKRPLNWRLLRPFQSIREMVKPEIVFPDADLGINDTRQLCFRKLRDDILMLEESADYRNWATHRVF